MAETHKEIVKVWIAPGCIVCDACESDCPEVFDVQEETCVIRPEAMKADFTKALTPSIIVAAEGCPVEVIKFETIDVEGPEPWAGKEKETATAGAGSSGGGAAAKKAVPVYDGPPDPKWAGLLKSAYTSGPRTGGGESGKIVQPAKAPAEAIAAAMPVGAPPDALAAAMVGSGYARPRLSVADRIRVKGGALINSAEVTRREFNIFLAIGWGAVAAFVATFLGAFQSYFVPKVIKEPPSSFRAGKISDYPTPGVYEQFKSVGVWIVHLPGNQLVAISTICTHLGCIPNWLPSDQKFKCPCHGSGFRMNGINFEGPAPRPLERYKISIDGEFVLVDKADKFRQELNQWGNAGSSIIV